MTRIVRRPAFIDDLEQVWNFIAEDNPDLADSFILSLERRYEMLARHPFSGAARFPNFPAMRLLPVGRDLIVYQPLPNDQDIELIRLLHAARDYHRYFSD